jgi:hypothetical protein
LDTPKVRVALILEPLPDDIDWSVRVRRALKTLLRSYRLRNRLFLDPRQLEDSPEWREVEPRDTVEASDATQRLS